ncbi:MAG: hypothetical protein LBL92_06905 [Propionibacteriaceae bacterium]|jgi:hypothetical protein|nr:hypothetical protein [Propionibacteriaceae bacterium]
MTDSTKPPAGLYDSVDLETEEFYDTAGHRITEESNQRLVEEVHKTSGRQSQTGPGHHPPVTNCWLTDARAVVDQAGLYVDGEWDNLRREERPRGASFTASAA